jgi:diguanylate cyclase (GGDEF)-like protein
MHISCGIWIKLSAGTDFIEKTMSTFRQFLFGKVKFRDSEEFEEFRFHFLIIILISGALFTALFIAGEHSKLNPISGRHVTSMTAFTLSTLTLWLLLRGHKERFLAIACLYETICLLEYISALTYVPEDELRVLWFMVNIPGVYILLGQRVGAMITALTVGGLIQGNPYLSAPYSANAIATLSVSLVYMAVFFHYYGDRSISYFVRMRESNEKLRYMATHDNLTGVLNARAYYASSEHLIRMAQRQQLPYAVLFVDLDHFKSINDTYGHAAGDIVLKSVASTLGRSIRESDLLGRIGGEEFSIFLPETSLDGAAQLAEHIRAAIENLRPRIGERCLRITASIGVAQNQQNDQSMLAIQQQADQAMYIAKSQGRNRVSCFSQASLCA